VLQYFDIHGTANILVPSSNTESQFYKLLNRDLQVYKGVITWHKY